MILVMFAIESRRHCASVQSLLINRLGDQSIMPRLKASRLETIA